MWVKNVPILKKKGEFYLFFLCIYLNVCILLIYNIYPLFSNMYLLICSLFLVWHCHTRESMEWFSHLFQLTLSSQGAPTLLQMPQAYPSLWQRSIPLFINNYILINTNKISLLYFWKVSRFMKRKTEKKVMWALSLILKIFSYWFLTCILSFSSGWMIALFF